MTRLEVEASEGRLDVVLSRAAGIPRADAQRAIARGMVRVDGRVRPKSHRLSGGERIEAELEPAHEIAPEPGGVPVRHEDAHLMVVAKPAGMVTHPTATRRSGTLVNRLLGMGASLSSEGGPDRPGIVHRLDAGTSGLMLVAKDDEAHRALARLMRRREVERTYLALARGSSLDDTFTVDAPVGRSGARMAVRRGTGREAATDFTVREVLDRATLLEAMPRTGRTHQIRVHLASIGHPILGDRAYGGGGDPARRLGLHRPFLHSWRLALDDPWGGGRIRVEEPLPPDLLEALERAKAG